MQMKLAIGILIRLGEHSSALSITINKFLILLLLQCFKLNEDDFDADFPKKVLGSFDFIN